MITERGEWYGRERVIHRCHSTEEAGQFIRGELKLNCEKEAKVRVYAVDGLHRQCMEFKIRKARYLVYLWRK